LTSFRSKTVRSLAWSFGSKTLSQVISIVFGIILARLLVPEDFGLITMVMVLMGFAGLLSDVGLGSALIQKKDVIADHFSAVFWFNSLIGLLLTICLIFLAPQIAIFYSRPELELIAVVLSFTFILSAISMVPRTRLAKELAFKKLAIVDFFSLFFSGCIAITMAFKGYGYWSLVAHQLIERLLSTTFVWLLSDWKPQLRHNIKVISELIGFGSTVFATRTLRHAALQADKLIIGKFLGAVSLGLYDKAYSMMLFPLQNISIVIGNVMFPSLSTIQDDVAHVRDIYLRMTGAISLLTFPMMAGMFVISESFVLGVLGEQWAEIIPLFKIFCVVGFFISIATVTGPVYLSQGKAKLQLKINLINQPLIIFGIIVGLKWGLIGIVIGFSITTIIGVLITWWIVGKLIKLKFRKIIFNLLPAFILSIVMAYIVSQLSSLLGETSHIVMFLYQFGMGVLSYVILVLIVKPKPYLEVIKVLKKEYVNN